MMQDTWDGSTLRSITMLNVASNRNCCNYKQKKRILVLAVIGRGGSNNAVHTISRLLRLFKDGR